MTDDTTRRSTSLLIDRPSPAFLRVTIRNQILASAGPYIYDREIKQAMRGTSPQATALRNKLGEVTAACRLAHQKQLAEQDQLIAAATTDDERRALIRHREKLKPPARKVSKEARNIAGSLTSETSCGDGKNLPKIAPGQEDEVRAEIHAHPELLLTKYRNYVAHNGVLSGCFASWQDGNASQRRVHPDVARIPVTEWPDIWSEKRRGKRAAESFVKAVEKIFNHSWEAIGTPLTNHDVTFGTAPEFRNLSVVEVARSLAAHETQTIAQHALNLAKRAEADALNAEYQVYEEWQLVQCLERELEDLHARSGNTAKEGFRLLFRHLGGHKRLFEQLRDALGKGASPDELCTLVDTVATNSRQRFGYVALYMAACKPHYQRLWDSRAEPDPDNADKHNWLVKRAAYNRAAQPRRTPQRALPHFVQHPVRSLYRQSAENSFKLGDFDLETRSFEIVDRWRGKETVVSATFARNSQLKPAPPNKSKEVQCFYSMGSGHSKQRPEFLAEVTSLAARISLAKAFSRIPSDLRARVSSAPDWSPDLVDDLVDALLPEVVRDRTRVYFDALLTVKGNKNTNKAFVAYRREIRKRSPNKDVLAGLIVQLQGLAVRGIDSGTANGGGLAILRFAGPDHPVPEGKIPLHVIPGVVTVYRESSEVIFLPGEDLPQSPEERRLWTLYEQALSLIRVQQDLISSGRRAQGDGAANGLSERLATVDLSALREHRGISRLLEGAAAAGNFFAAARIVEQANRLAHRFVRKEEARISKARGRKDAPREIEQPLLGGKSHRRIKLLERRITWLRNFAKREFVSRGGIIRAYQRRGVDALSHITDAQEHRTHLKTDRVLQIVAKSRTTKTETIASFAENLSSFRMSVSQHKSTNSILAIWSHQEIEKHHRGLSALTGEIYDTVDSHFTSRFSAVHDGAPGIRMEKVQEHLCVHAQRDIAQVPYPLRDGDYYPRSKGGKYFVTLDDTGNPVIETAEENAGTNIALRGISPWTERVVMLAIIVPGGLEPLIYDPQTRRRLVRTRNTYGGDVFVSGEELPKAKCLDGKELKLMRDPSARFFGFGEWVETGAFWRSIVGEILRAMYAARVCAFAAE